MVELQPVCQNAALRGWTTKYILRRSMKGILLTRSLSAARWVPSAFGDMVSRAFRR